MEKASSKLTNNILLRKRRAEELEGYPDTGLARKQAEKPVFRYAGRGRDIFRIQRRRETYRENLRGESGGSAGIYGCVYGGREQNSVRAANG